MGEFKEFVEKFVDALEIEESSELSRESYFRELEEWGSLSAMMLIAMIDEEYGKSIGDKEIKVAETLEDLFKLAVA